MRLATLRKKRKPLDNMLSQTVSCSYSLGGRHGTDLNATDRTYISYNYFQFVGIWLDNMNS